MSIQSIVPWFAKAGAKILIARLPIPYALWAKVRLFRHGRNDDPGYSYRVFREHFQIAQPPPGFTCVELGPGDAVASAVLTRAFGGTRSYQVDVGFFATTDLSVYRSIASHAQTKGHGDLALESAQNFSEMMRLLDASYLVEGLASLRAIPDASVDFIFSHTCLQLVRAAEFDAVLSEFRRIIRPSGCMSHRIAFNNHLDDDANSLRFSDRVWESELVAKSGFYTNRLSPSETICAFEHAGFANEIIERNLRKRIPDRRKLAARFRNRSDLDLQTAGITLRARPI